jgi:hypothetical protein
MMNFSGQWRYFMGNTALGKHPKYFLPLAKVGVGRINSYICMDKDGKDVDRYPTEYVEGTDLFLEQTVSREPMSVQKKNRQAFYRIFSLQFIEMMERY